MTQESWPFENGLVGVITRQEIHDELGRDDDDYEETDAGERDGEGDATDVFLVEGQQLRYGMKKAWEVCY